MQEIVDIRKSLQSIRYALDHGVPSRRPRFGGVVRNVSPSDAIEVEEADQANPIVADIRDESSLYAELDAAVVKDGIEALAWYHPFHVAATDWGIYVPVTSLYYGAERWFSPRISPFAAYSIGPERTAQP